MPTPGAEETQDEFVSRCMSFLDDEGSDLDQDQRLAACHERWRNAKGESSLKQNDKEQRYIPVEAAELRVAQMDDGTRAIEGYAAVFNQLSEDLGGFREKIAPGAFKKALKNSDARMLYNHNDDYVLGRESNGTLKLKEDDKGLIVRATPPKWAEWIMESIDRGDINKMSFGFWTEKDEWDHKENIRTLLEVAELVEVSPVTFPAYPSTSVALRRKEQSRVRLQYLEAKKRLTTPGEAEPKLVEPDGIGDAPKRFTESEVGQRINARLRKGGFKE